MGWDLIDGYEEEVIDVEVGVPIAIRGVVVAPGDHFVKSPGLSFLHVPQPGPFARGESGVPRFLQQTGKGRLFQRADFLRTPIAQPASPKGIASRQ